MLKFYIDPEDVWNDVVAYYKSGRVDTSMPVRIVLTDRPALDTGGVRRQVYNDVLNDIASNKHARVFEGPPRRLRPIVSPENKPTLRLLGTIIGHGIRLEGLRFSHLSPVCYWLLVSGEEAALRYVSLADLPTDAGQLVQNVSYHKVIM